MNIQRLFTETANALLFLVVLSSCVQNDEWETPPLACENKFAASNITMANFVSMVPATGFMLIEEDQIFDGYVNSSDENGNFFKTISFQDDPVNPSVGLQIEIDKTGNYADFPIGSHIRINAKGLRLGKDRGLVKIGSVDPTFPIGRIPSSLVSKYVAGVCSGNGLEIKALVPKALPSLTDAKQDQYINILVTVPYVQFASVDLGKTYLDYSAGLGVDTDRNIEDNTGAFSTLRNSGFFSFGAFALPKGNGALTFVVSKFNQNYQMLIRGLNDVKIPDSGLRFNPTPPKGGTSITYLGSFTEDFESYTLINLEVFPKYINDAEVGNRYWQLRSFSNNKYIQLTAFNAGGDIKTFFAVPINFTLANTVQFKTAFGSFNGMPLKVYTSTDYSPLGDINAATLTDITSQFAFANGPATGFGAFLDSGVYQLPTALTGNGFLIFEYSGGTITTTVQIDDIMVN